MKDSNNKINVFNEEFADKKDLDSNTSLYDLISAFSKLHQSFISEYNALPKFSIFSIKDYEDYYSFREGRDNYRVLKMKIINKSLKCKHKELYLYMREINGEILPYLSTDVAWKDHPDYYNKDIPLNREKVRPYIDLFDKYQVLFQLYNRIKGMIVFSDNIHSLYIRANNSSDSFVSNIKEIRVAITSENGNNDDYVGISINVSDGLEIITKDSKMRIDGKNVPIDTNTCLEFLKNTHVSSKYLVRPASDRNEIQYGEVIQNLISSAR